MSSGFPPASACASFSCPWHAREHHCSLDVVSSVTQASHAGVLRAGAGNQSTAAAIAGAEDGTEPIFQDSHVASEFGYVFDKAEGIAPLTSYIAVLHFAGAWHTSRAHLPLQLQQHCSAALQLFLHALEASWRGIHCHTFGHDSAIPVKL